MGYINYHYRYLIFMPALSRVEYRATNNYETINNFCYPKELWDNNRRIQKVFSEHADGT